MKQIIPVMLLIGAVIFSACSPAQNVDTTAETPATAVTTFPASADGGIEMKLAAGTLSLEDTADAVTVEQAKALLPLWKAVKALTSSDTSTEAEIQAIYKQIQAEMTEAQVSAIQALDMSGDTMAALMTRFDVQPGGGALVQRGSGDGSTSGIPDGGFPGGSAQGGRPPAGDFVPPSGGGPGGGGPSFSGGGSGGGTVIIEGGGLAVPPDLAGGFQTTPGAPSANGRRGMFMNNLFVQPLIDLLKERAG